MLSGVSRPLSNLLPQTFLLQYYTTVFSKVGSTMFFHMVALCCPCAFPSDSAFVALGYQSNQRETKGKPKGNQEGEPGTNQRQDKGEPKKNERETRRKPKGHQRETKGQPKGNESGIS